MFLLLMDCSDNETNPRLLLVRLIFKYRIAFFGDRNHLFVHGTASCYMKPDRLIPMLYIGMAGRAIRPPETELFRGSPLLTPRTDQLRPADKTRNN